MTDFLLAGFSKDDMLSMSLDLVAANKSHILIADVIILQLQGKSTQGMTNSCATMVCISKDAKGFFCLVK